jgi:hypothetical protein
MKTRILSLALALGLSRLIAADTSFAPAQPDARMGDWQGANVGAQVSVAADGSLHALVFTEFDRDGAVPLAVLKSDAASPSILKSESGWSGTIDETRLTLRAPDGEHILKRTVRTSPTLGAAPPEGAVVLLSGGAAEAWVTKDGKDWLKESGPARWKQVGDSLEIVPGADSLISRQHFGDARVHVEFRTLGTPTNSGVYLQARYEVNINETYGKLEGNPNGGLDNCSDVKPKVRATRAPLEWQTLDIEFRAPRFDSSGKKETAARATVFLNGVQLYDEEMLRAPKGAAGRLGEAPAGPLLLQEHGHPVQFRNIWVLPRP